MILSIAWRNLWRNKVRSIIVLMAVAIGLFAGVFSTGFFKGMAEMRLKDALKTETSHIQIHQKLYKENNDAGLYISHSQELMDKVSTNPNVQGVCRRVISECMINSAHGSHSLSLVGIEPGQEQKVTDMSEKLLEGHYLEDVNKRIPRILIGKSLAKDLKLKLKSKVTVDMVDVNGHISTKLYKVCGIFETSNTGYDERTAFVNRDELVKQLSIDADGAHELAIYLKDGELLEDSKAEIAGLAPDLDTKTWKEISKELALMTDSMDQYMYIFVVIILLALCFGIINTMLMVVLERRKELGMLMAVGMNRSRIFRMIMLESVFLSLSGGILGNIIGYLVLKHFETTPIVLSMFDGFEQYGYSNEVYTSINPEMLITTTFMVIILGIVSALYPARKATRLNPADSIRYE